MNNETIISATIVKMTQSYVHSLYEIIPNILYYNNIKIQVILFSQTMPVQTRAQKAKMSLVPTTQSTTEPITEPTTEPPIIEHQVNCFLCGNEMKVVFFDNVGVVRNICCFTCVNELRSRK